MLFRSSSLFTELLGRGFSFHYVMNVILIMFWWYLVHLLIICFLPYWISTHRRWSGWLQLKYMVTKPLLIWELKVPFLLSTKCLCFYINILILLINNYTVFVTFMCMCLCKVAIGMDITLNTIFNIVKNFGGSIQSCMHLKSCQVLRHEGMSLCVYVGDLWWGH